MHESMFSYNLSRPYPYRWFTWVVFMGGAIATVILSLINFSAVGLELTIEHVADPTEIESPDKTAWYQHRPWSWASKTRSMCSEQTISVGSTYYTKNGALPYTVEAIYANIATQSTTVASQAYKSSPICDCMLDKLVILPQDGWSVDVTLSMNCSIHSDKKVASLILLTGFTFDGTGVFMPSASNSLPVFPASDNLNETWPSMYWGKNLISTYLTLWHDNWTPIFNTSTVYTRWNGKDFGLTETIPGSFTNSAHNWLFSNNASDWGNASFTDRADEIARTYTHHNTTSLSSSDPSTLLAAIVTDATARAVYWTALTDLGQSASNILADPQELTEYINTSMAYMRPSLPSGFGVHAWPYNVWQHTQSNTSSSLSSSSSFFQQLHTGPPSVSPTVFSQEYVCQVPRVKAAGGLVVSVLVADLVFLQALWRGLNWLTTLILTRRDPGSNYCSGCHEEVMLRNGQDVEICGTEQRRDEEQYEDVVQAVEGAGSSKSGAAFLVDSVSGTLNR